MVIQIGFMQGRLSPMINGKIQSFPKDNWQKYYFESLDEITSKKKNFLDWAKM